MPAERTAPSDVPLQHDTRESGGEVHGPFLARGERNPDAPRIGARFATAHPDYPGGIGRGVVIGHGNAIDRFKRRVIVQLDGFEYPTHEPFDGMAVFS